MELKDNLIFEHFMITMYLLVLTAIINLHLIGEAWMSTAHNFSCGTSHTHSTVGMLSAICMQIQTSQEKEGGSEVARQCSLCSLSCFLSILQVHA